MDIYRKTLKFLVPVSEDALNTFTLTGRDVVPIYVNPQSISIRDNKIIQKTLTKGGYVIQYWGEELSTMSVNGTTGSAGIEGIHILRDIYRNEQIRMKDQLLTKLENKTSGAVQTLADTSEVEQASNFITNMKNTDIGSAVGGFFDTAKSIVESFANVLDSTAEETINRVILRPTLAAYAVSMDVYFQGERYRGYFTTFTVNERAASPGLFDYTFQFMITKRVGKRSNFMPWHRTPLDDSGNPVSATIPIAKQDGIVDVGLTYPTTYNMNEDARFKANPEDLVTEGPFAGDTISSAEEVGIPLNRNGEVD